MRSIKLQNRYVNLLKRLNTARSRKQIYNHEGGGIIDFIKHKLNMRKFNNVKRKIDKLAVPLERISDTAKELYNSLYYLINNLASTFNDIIDTNQRIEILRIRRIDESAKNNFAARDIVDYGLEQGRQNIVRLDRTIDVTIEEIEKHIIKNDKYILKMDEAIQKYLDAIKDSEIILAYQAKANVLSDLTNAISSLKNVTKGAKSMRNKVSILHKDYDTLEKFGYQFLQEKSKTTQQLISLKLQINDLIVFYRELLEKQKTNVKTIDLWKANVEEFYQILSFILGTKSVFILKDNKIYKNLDDIIKYISYLIEIYKRANDIKLASNYLEIFAKYKDLFTECRDVYLKKCMDLIISIKDEYFNQVRVTPIKQYNTRVDDIIGTMNKMFFMLLWFSNFIKFYKDTKYNENLSDFMPKREIDFNKLVKLADPLVSQSGGGNSVEWGSFKNSMSSLIQESIESSTDKRVPMIEAIDNFINMVIDKQDMTYFMQYYHNNNNVRNRIGFFKREDIKDHIYTYYNEYNEFTKSFSASDTKIKIDIASRPEIRPNDKSNSALIKVKGNLYLYYPGTKLQYFVPNSPLKTEAQKYMFFCFVFGAKSLQAIDENTRVYLLDIYSGYPIIHPGRDHMSLLNAEFIYDALFEKNKNADVQNEFVKDVATSIIVKRYNSLQLVHQNYCDILDDSKDESYFVSKFSKNAVEHSFTNLPNEAMYPFNEWEIDKYRAIPITRTGTNDKGLEDFIKDSDQKDKENIEQLEEEKMKDLINAQNKQYINDVLFNPNFPISVDPVFKTFITANNVNELEDFIMEKTKELFEGDKRRSSSKIKKMQQRQLNELKSTAFMDNLNLLRSSIEQISLREAVIYVFKEKTSKELHMLDWDFASTKEQRMQPLKPELADEISQLAKEPFDVKIMEKYVGKSSIQDRFDEYMKSGDDPYGRNLENIYIEILPALKKMSQTEYKNFMFVNFLDAKPLHDRRLLDAFLTRLAYVSSAVRSDLSKEWFIQNGFQDPDNGLIKSIVTLAEIIKKKKQQGNRPNRFEDEIQSGGNFRSRKTHKKHTNYNKLHSHKRT
jgi:hypothetical protein